MKTLFSLLAVVVTMVAAGAYSQDSPIFYQYVEKEFSSLPDFGNETIAETGFVDEFTLAVRNREDAFAIRYETCLVVEYEGWYEFYLRSDDGSRLTIDGQVVIDHDGFQNGATASGTIFLAAGNHDLILEYFEFYGDQLLELTWAPDGGTPEPLEKWNLKPPGEPPIPPAPPEGPNCPDLCIGKNAGNLVGGGVRNKTGRRQIAELVMKDRQKCFLATLKNVGHYAETYRVSGTKRDKDFRFKYFDRSRGNANITAYIKRGGYLVHDLEPGQTQYFKICVKPMRKIKFWHKYFDLHFDATTLDRRCMDRVIGHVKKLPAKRKKKHRKH